MSEFPAANACTNHPDVIEGVQRCARCARPFCGNCLVTIGGLPYCAECKSEQLLDVRSGVSPDAQPLANRGRRVVALIIDYIPWMIIGLVVGFRAAFTGHQLRTFDPLLIGIGATFVVYDALMMQWKSATVGKLLMRIKVVRPDGANVTAGQAWGRAAARWALGYLYIIDWPPIFFTAERLCVHDMLARTRVVRVD